MFQAITINHGTLNGIVTNWLCSLLSGSKFTVVLKRLCAVCIEFGVAIQRKIVSGSYFCILFLSFWCDSTPVGQGLLIHQVSRSHTTTHHSRQDSSGRVITSSQRPLPDNTQQLQQTDTDDSVGIRTHKPSRRAAAHLRLRPKGHQDLHLVVTPHPKWTNVTNNLISSLPKEKLFSWYIFFNYLLITQLINMINIFSSLTGPGHELAYLKNYGCLTYTQLVRFTPNLPSLFVEGT